MESEARQIKDGRAYNHLFPRATGIDESVKKEANVEDTVELIRKVVRSTLWQSKDIAAHLGGGSLEEVCSRIWHFIYDHIQYKGDEAGIEQIRSPRRTWADRKQGVDCDCYSTLISSILINLNIPHRLRITKYPKRPPQVPRWQHIYVIVPRSGQLNVASRDDYITLDCVKDAFDDEQEFLENKDYDMRLDFLDGIADQDEDVFYSRSAYKADTTDISDLAALYDDELEMGNIFKKVQQGVKKVAQKAGTIAQKVGDKVGQGIRVINRFANPATILLRNGFLLSMKANLMNVAGRLRYAYLSDEQARKLNMNLSALQKLRAVKDRAETIYWQAGGKKENLKKAILGGKGNKDGKVALSGLYGFDDVYMDMDEYNIIHGDMNAVNGLGEIASGSAIAAASAAVAAISETLKQVKGLFSSSQGEQAFQSESDNAGDASSLPATITEDDSLPASNPVTIPIPTTPSYETTTPPRSAVALQPAESVLPASATTGRSMVDASASTSAPRSLVTQTQGQGLVQRASTWVRENPGKTLLITGAVLGATYALVKSMSSSGRAPAKGTGSSGGLNGLPKTRKKRKHRHGRGSQARKKQKVFKINLM